VRYSERRNKSDSGNWTALAGLEHSHFCALILTHLCMANAKSRVYSTCGCVHTLCCGCFYQNSFQHDAMSVKNQLNGFDYDNPVACIWSLKKNGEREDFNVDDSRLMPS
jgi:hypothetical protein